VRPEWTIRGARPGDEQAVLDVANAHGNAMWGENTVGLDEVQQWFTDPTIDPEHDFLLAFDADGRLGAFTLLEDPATDHSVVWTRLVLHPDHGDEAVGEELLARIETRAAEHGAAGARQRGGCAAPDAVIAGVLRRRGYELVRHFFRMLAPLDAPPAAPAWPEGLELRPVDPEGDLMPLFIADEEAFEDHWGYVRVSYELWLHWMTGSTYDPGLWFVAYDGDEIAGYALCKPQEGGDPSTGWVEVLGVRRQWRRRGLAVALLLHAFGEFHRRGHARVGLGVDADNTTGAVRLYEKAGMRPVRQWDVYERRL
jgi:mycothiol synthase